ncbi:MAG TPA: SdiA-regulated domain-containing protein [Chitinophagaceae bacterium]
MLKRDLIELIEPRNSSGSLCLFLLIILLAWGCNSSPADDKSFSNPPGYNLNKPRIFKLPPVLDEISGIVYNAKDNSVLSINDEHGWLYKIHLKDDLDLEKWQYSKGADFEDLVLIDSMFYVLESNGNILQFRFLSPDSVNVKEHVLPLQGRNEFEILYHDKTRNQLILVCKDCEQDDKNSLSAFAFSLDSSAYITTPAFVIDIRKIEELMDEKKVRFKPSAAGVHPLTGELFVISSINKVVVVADTDGNPKQVYRINPKIYKQPEGIAFTPRGDLIISNESADIGAANILFFKRTGTK